MFEQPCLIEANHPALAGHFPGRPLVPGVMLLECVADALRAWRGQRLERVVEAKFLAPLLPDQLASVHLTAGASAETRVRFEIQRDGIVLARGVIEGVA
ncbi:MAG: hydroxymyristoyl-ACP dehydratase [Rhodanobacter sp.]